MNPIVSSGGATALALVPIFFATAQALAHDAHNKKKAREALDEQPASWQATLRTRPVIPVEENLHDHAQHGQNADSHVGVAGAGAPASNLPKPIAWLGQIPPPLTHFPLALLISGAVFAAISGWFFPGVRRVDQDWWMTACRWAGTSVALSSMGSTNMHGGCDDE